MVVGESGWDVETSMGEEDSEDNEVEQGRVDRDRPPSVLERGNRKRQC